MFYANRYSNTLSSHSAYVPGIRADIYSGTFAGVHRTPTYVVDRVLIDTTGGLRALFEATQNVATQRRQFGVLAQ